MMGTKERSFAPLVNVSVEDLVPADHFYRHLERTLNLSFVREFVQETYTGTGRPSIDPVVFFKTATGHVLRGYRARAKDCNHCPLKATCTTSKQGRTLCRSVDETCLDQVCAYQSTEAYKKAWRLRQVWVEPLFAEAKDWHGMRRFRLRRLWSVNSEALMTAAGLNLKRLLKKRGWGRRPFPAEALCVPRQSHLHMRIEAQTHISIEQLLIALCIDTLCKPLEKREAIALVYALFLTLWWLPPCSSLEAFAVSLLTGRVYCISKSWRFTSY